MVTISRQQSPSVKLSAKAVCTAVGIAILLFLALIIPLAHELEQQQRIDYPAATAKKDYVYDISTFTSKSRHALPCDPPPTNSAGDPPRGFLSQQSARVALKQFVDARTKEKGKPRFVPSLNVLMEEARRQNRSMVTVQLGGMDGKTGDPMYRFSEFQSDISNWIPVVMEPVPDNFDKLVETYESHVHRPQSARGMTCPHVLHQMANYDASLQDPPDSGTCPFCHFDYDREECKDWSDHMKKETGSMECDSAAKRKCFKASPFVCTTIREALHGVGLTPRDVVALQMDVEGYEKMMIEGYFGEIGEDELPPIINFESKVLRGRGQLEDVERLLKEKGYGVHLKHVDALAILGAQGL